MTRQGYVDPNWPNPNGSGDASIIIYGYIPSFPLDILGIVFFTILLLAHSFRIIQHRNWTFIPVIIACVLEVIGYIFRALSSKADPYRISFFVAQYFCITVAPVFISASIYVYLTQLSNWALGYNLDIGLLKKIGTKVVLWIFITADVVCTILQITGAAMIGSKTSKHEDPTTANNILLVGLAAQAVAFLIFLILLASLVWSIARTDYVAISPRGHRHHQNSPVTRNKMYIFALCAAGVLIMVRTVFRLIETAEGVFGYLSSHEAFFGALEFAPVVVAVGMLAIWSPGGLHIKKNSLQGEKGVEMDEA